MRQSLELKLGQRLSMTPQLRQAIRLLQLSTLELAQEVRQALESNPLLEEAEAAEIDDAVPAPDQVEAEDEDDEPGLDLEDDRLVTPADASAWEDRVELVELPARTRSDGPIAEIESRVSEPATLRDHLCLQMTLTTLSPGDQNIARAIIESIDNDGYLGETLDEIATALNGEDEERVETDEVEAVLHRIQSFDPPGVGARDPEECLLLQLRYLPPETPGLTAARTLVSEHLSLLASRNFAALRRAMGLDNEDLQQAVALIQTLNPHPGETLQSTQTHYVVPDVTVRRHEGGRWVVSLTPEACPQVRINHRYTELIRRGNNSNDNQYLKTQLQEARWFLKSLTNRSETLLNVARAIVDRQRAFLERGEDAMQPLVLHEIADELDLHESTVSRVTSQKYMLTPRGVFEFKHFFSSHVETQSGGRNSATAIRSLMKKIIAAEPPERPVSDNQIVQQLAGRGVQVARRTVAKYREAMRIPPSSQRKSIL